MREWRISAVGAQGDGLSEGNFIPLTLPGELVTAEMANGRGELIEVLEASSERVTPPCRHFGVCGGCAFQHWDAEPYLEWKRDQIRFQLSQVGLETEILPTFASPPGSRRRIAVHARGGKGGVRLGFKERRSWNLV